LALRPMEWIDASRTVSRHTFVRRPREARVSLSTTDIAHILIALAALLLAAHSVGTLFVRVRQPRAIGEVVGGLLLGPTLLELVAPGASSWIFPATGAVPIVVAAVAQLGLLLLMFMTGTEIRTIFHRRERKTITSVFVSGMVLPLIAGIGLLQVIDQESLWGPNGGTTSFLLVFAIAMAVTSIPVISRIMHDLGILDTDFARVVLGVAVLEDIVLYVVLAVAVGYAGGTAGTPFGLPAALGIRSGTGADMAYHVLATIAFLGIGLLLGPRAYRRMGRLRVNLIRRASPLAYQFTFMILATIAGLFLGVQAFFGAFVAGIIVGASSRTSGSKSSEATLAIKGFSLAFFIPIYFAVIGLGLDLVHGFSVGFFMFFLVTACAVKAGSVYLGARVAGESNASSWNLAVAMNARGGPGIVVASTAFAAGIIGEPFYAVLVLLAIVTSLVAGSWLERIPRDRLLARPANATASDAVERTT
jgi:Kef-type K+ transport system membrane component KefB